MLPELLGCIVRLGQVVLGQFFQSHLAVDGHEYVHHQRDQRLVRADIRRRLFTSDMLFAGGQGENESTLAIAICGLTYKASGHLPDKLFPSRDYATIRSTETKRHAKGLRFHGDNVRLPWRFDDSQ